MMAGCTGGVAAVIFSAAISRPNLRTIINGVLGGLVSITASSAYVPILAAIAIGGIGGGVVIGVERLLEKLRIDDPVGAISVHLGCGIWGTLAVGIFANPYALDDFLLEAFDPKAYNLLAQIGTQIFGIVVVNVVTACLSLVAWIVIGLTLHCLSRQTRFSGLVERGHQVFFTKIIHQVRMCLRVSERDEVRGNDGYFLKN